MLTQLYSDLGTPASYRMMDGNSVHAYKFVNKAGKVTYVKFNWKSMQGIKNLTMEEAGKLQGMTSSHLTTDLYNAIDEGKFPSWELRVQLLKPEDLDNFDFNPLDATKIWTDIPFRTIGKMTLNKVPANFFQSTESVAMAPTNFVSGLEPSEDRLLQGRLFSYFDTQLYRLGSPNFKDLPVNRPRGIEVVNNHVDGVMSTRDQSDTTNYAPSRTNPQFKQADRARFAQMPISGTIQQQPISKTLNFQQAGELYRTFSPADRMNLVENLAADLGQVRDVRTRCTMNAHFYRADKDYGTALAKAVRCRIGLVKRLASKLQE